MVMMISKLMMGISNMMMMISIMMMIVISILIRRRSDHLDSPPQLTLARFPS